MRRIHGRWLWLTCIAFFPNAVLIVVVAMASDSLPWPWPRTQPVLLAALMALLLGVTGWFSLGQHRLLRILVQDRERDAGYAERVAEHCDRMLACLQVTRLLATRTELPEILYGVTDAGYKLFNCEQVSILLLDSEKKDLVVRAVTGPDREEMVGTRQEVGSGIAGHVAQTGEPAVLGSSLPKERFRNLRHTSHTISSSMVVPISLREECIGVLCVSNNLPGHVYDGEDLQVIQVFADLVAVCIRHTEQAAWLRQRAEGDAIQEEWAA